MVALCSGSAESQEVPELRQKPARVAEQWFLLSADTAKSGLNSATAIWKTPKPRRGIVAPLFKVTEGVSAIVSLLQPPE
jgi:hypothetical protein